MVLALRVELREVGARGSGDLGDAGDARGLGVGVVEEDQIAHRHVAHEVARLVVADAVPRLALDLRQILDPEHVGLALHQPELLLARSHQGFFARKSLVKPALSL